jgi:hypothetical protein
MANDVSLFILDGGSPLLHRYEGAVRDNGDRASHHQANYQFRCCHGE